MGTDRPNIGKFVKTQKWYCQDFQQYDTQTFDCHQEKNNINNSIPNLAFLS